MGTPVGIRGNSMPKKQPNEQAGHDTGLNKPRVWFIRHGESEAQIGKAASHTEEVRLTQRGENQAEEIATRFLMPPALIITSPYWRAWRTARPTIQRFSGVPHEVWPEVQEFTYLGSLAGICSTKQERRVMVNAYWERCDPAHHDGVGESFTQFIGRASLVVERLRQIDGSIVVFTHEQFIRAVQGLLYGWMEQIPEPFHMRRFRKVLLNHPLPYGCMLEIPVDPEDDNRHERSSQREYLLRSTLLSTGD